MQAMTEIADESRTVISATTLEHSGQIVHRRTVSKKIIFLDIELTGSSEVIVIHKLQLVEILCWLTFVTIVG